MEVTKICLQPSLIKLGMFGHFNEDTKDRIKIFLLDHSSLSNVLIRHVWKLDGDNCVYVEVVWDMETNVRQDQHKKIIDIWQWKEGDMPQKTFAHDN